MDETQWVEHGQSRRLGDLRPHPRNSRQHSAEQVAQIAASMGEWDFTVPVLIDDGGVILAGHGRQLAGISKWGADHVVPVSIAHGWSDAQKRAYIIADNRLTELGQWDQTILRAELMELDQIGFTLDLTGFALADFVPPVRGADPDDVPPAPKDPVSQLGDLWVMGDHRIICGDSTDAPTVEKLLAGCKPHLMVTDPPYGVNYDPDWRNARMRADGTAVGGRAVGVVKNDNIAQWSDAYDLFPGDVAYAWSADLRSREAIEGLEASGFEIRAQIIWAKQQMVIGRGHYHFKHEPCWYAVRKGRTAHWSGDRKQTTVWDISKPHKSETGHSTQKPVECMKRPIENNSRRGDAVYEPFCGSGTTIIAAEMTGRRCLAVELSPAYVDVAVRRWQTFTGRVATTESGKTFDDVAAERFPQTAPASAR